jgi:class 3 adenylate cyclase
MDASVKLYLEDPVEIPTTRKGVVDLCKRRGIYLCPKGNSLEYWILPTPENVSAGLKHLAKCFGVPPEVGAACPTDGLWPAPSGVMVSESLLAELHAELEDPESDVAKVSCIPTKRCFLYVDISEFSKMKPGIQLTAVTDLLHLTLDETHWRSPMIAAPAALQDVEARLCIGDGYICVLRNATLAAYFAAHLAHLIEAKRAPRARTFTHFHYRMGLHIGPVRRLWEITHQGDPGRWNYIGDGINDGQRVLSVINSDKSTPDLDDVIYLSEELKVEIQRCQSELGELVLRNLQERGRPEDKHGLKWRVHQLSHAPLVSEAKSDEPSWDDAEKALDP